MIPSPYIVTGAVLLIWWVLSRSFEAYRSADRGSSKVLVQVEAHGAATNIFLGTPGQSISVSPNFSSNKSRIIRLSSCPPLADCFETSQSLSFEWAPHGDLDGTRYVSDYVNVAGFGFVDTKIKMVSELSAPGESLSIVSGELALSPSSVIGESRVIEMQGVDLVDSLRGTIIDGFTLSLPRMLSDFPKYVSETVVPLSPGSYPGWNFAADVTLNGSPMSYRRSTIIVEPSRSTTTLPTEMFRRLIDKLNQEGIEAFSSEGFLMLPCDQSGRFSFPIKFGLSTAIGDLVPIYFRSNSLGEPILSIQRNGMFCPAAISQGDMDDPEVIIGISVLLKRHSVILDARNSVIRFRDYIVSGLQVSRPIPTSRFPKLPEYSAEFATHRAESILFLDFAPELNNQSCRYRLTSAHPSPCEIGSLCFEFPLVNPDCGPENRVRRIPGVFHFDVDSIEIDRTSSEATIQFSVATDRQSPIYRVSVVTDNVSMRVVLEQIDLGDQFSQLEIQTGPAGHSIEDDCNICQGAIDVGESASAITACGHMFHENCLRRWVAVKPTCTRCTRVIKYRPLEEFSD